jgi:hypothetical protein
MQFVRLVSAIVDGFFRGFGARGWMEVLMVSLGFGAREANASVEFLWMFVRLAPKGELQVLMISWSLGTRR